tara:strand:+ start:3068 stop:5359 length:2292 start_codon:yes stop_codon:yes gene_type:complete
MPDKKSNISKYQKKIDNNKYLQYLIYVTYKEETGKTSNGMPNIGSFNESNDPKVGGNSSAFGMGQFTTDTRNDILKKYGIDAWSTDRREQEAAVIALTEHRGYLAQVSSGRFEGLAADGPWEAFKSPDSEILTFSDLGDWSADLENMREGARYAPEESIAKIDAEIWAMKDSIYKSKGVSPLDNTIEGSSASSASSKIVKQKMAELEKTLPKGQDKTGERVETRATTLDALNKEYGLGDYKVPEFEGVSWKKEAYEEGLKGIFEDYGLTWNSDKSLEANLKQISTLGETLEKKSSESASGFKTVSSEEAYKNLLEFSTTYGGVIKESTYKQYEDNFVRIDKPWYENLGNTLTFGLSGGDDVTGQSIEDKIAQITFQKKYDNLSAKLDAEIENADKYNYGVKKRRELQEQKNKLESIKENRNLIGKDTSVLGLEGVDFSDIDSTLSAIDKSVSSLDTTEKIEAETKASMVNLEEDETTNSDTREQEEAISLPKKGLKSVSEEEELTLRKRNVAPTNLEDPSITKAGQALMSLKIGGQRASEFLQDKGVTADSVNNALRAGAGLLSLYDATRKDKVNKAKVSPLMLEAVRKADEISQNGMPYEQQMAAIKDMNNAYAGAMKNVMAISGGQRGAALANMGGVDAARVNGLVDLAAKSSDMRMEGMKMYQTAVGDYTKMKLTADMSNEALQKKLDTSRKDRLAKVGSTLYEQAMEFNRNFKDEDTNKSLVDAINNYNNNDNNEANQLGMENITKIANSGFNQQEEEE